MFLNIIASNTVSVSTEGTITEYNEKIEGPIQNIVVNGGLPYREESIERAFIDLPVGWHKGRMTVYTIGSVKLYVVTYYDVNSCIIVDDFLNTLFEPRTTKLVAVSEKKTPAFVRRIRAIASDMKNTDDVLEVIREYVGDKYILTIL